MAKTIHKATNWNEKDEIALMFWNQNIAQFWTDTEFTPSADTEVWNTLSPEVQSAYKRALGGLTLLDTKQGLSGMPLIALHVAELLGQDKKASVLQFMGAMECMHAKSYSTIFTTICTEEETQEVFDWVEKHGFLQKKAGIITTYYRRLLKPIVTPRELYMAMCVSVLLESYLFYSGFYLPLKLAGQGRMKASGEIINLILRDESIHGVFVGLIAQQIFNEHLTDLEKEHVQVEVRAVLDELMRYEDEYTGSLYDAIGETVDVNKFTRYNANKAMMNLGYEAPYPEEEINPIVKNGLDTQTKNHDFFSQKGNGYVKAMNVQPITDDDILKVLNLAK
ncbi:ribonucleotide reductase class Ia beta subunit [Bacillus phage BCD7]|uniref:ribonucleoside-diphosphate reductase n=1 Tax=Bacillus phage BCD7 TaxID=1136534 RepID=J9PV96_9CAUD|nr:ribonucleotide reductase class Ia beta subunit [Bacillus phage BCD7]AEZ50485.1 ribonucleotide-diphosphate reductase subunit beta [Bacillus phage BCD7]